LLVSLLPATATVVGIVVLRQLPTLPEVAGVALVVVAVIARVARRLRSLPWAVALGMLLGGALGNLTDRVFRSPGPLTGHVVDFLELPHWPVFNLADSAIVVASALMVGLSFRGLHLDGTVDSARTRAEAEPDSGSG
jgi:signal peptidase II